LAKGTYGKLEGSYEEEGGGKGGKEINRGNLGASVTNLRKKLSFLGEQLTKTGNFDIAVKEFRYTTSLKKEINS